MSGMRRTKYQLWCYYETADVWVMHGFFDTEEQADAKVQQLRDDVNTPCMPDWHVVEVRTDL